MASFPHYVTTRVALNRKRGEFDADGQKQIDELLKLRNVALFRAFVDAMEAEHSQAVAAAEAAGEAPILDFTRWLVEFIVTHKDEIIAIIKVLLTL